jgi:hypothetical protein
MGPGRLRFKENSRGSSEERQPREVVDQPPGLESAMTMGPSEVHEYLFPGIEAQEQWFRGDSEN